MLISGKGALKQPEPERPTKVTTKAAQRGEEKRAQEAAPPDRGARKAVARAEVARKDQEARAQNQ